MALGNEEKSERTAGNKTTYDKYKYYLFFSSIT